MFLYLQLLTADPQTAGDRKHILAEDKYNATNFLTLWDFEGVLKYSPLFYGWYTNRDGKEKGYRLPLAYFMTGLVVYTYSFVATLRKYVIAIERYVFDYDLLLEWQKIRDYQSCQKKTMNAFFRGSYSLDGIT